MKYAHNESSNWLGAIGVPCDGMLVSPPLVGDVGIPESICL
jgi:hypothetical protein